MKITLWTGFTTASLYHILFLRVTCGWFGTMADWDADDFEPDVPATVTVPKVTDKWEGEDEDDDVKVTPTIFAFFTLLLTMLG